MPQSSPEERVSRSLHNWKWCLLGSLGMMLGTLLGLEVNAQPRPEKRPEIILLAGEEKPEKKDELVKTQVALSVDRLPAGKTCQAVILISVKDGWHIKANPPQPETMVPTEVSLTSKLGVKVTQVKYPKGKILKRPMEDPEAVYDHDIVVLATLEIPGELTSGQTDDLEFLVKYQACHEEDNKCLPPKTAKLKGKLNVAGPGETVKLINQEYFPPAKK